MSRQSIWCSWIFSSTLRIIHPWPWRDIRSNLHKLSLGNAMINNCGHTVHLHTDSGTMLSPIIWLSPSLTTIYCKWMSHNCTLYLGELQWLCIKCAYTVKQPLFSIVADSCRSDHRAAPPKPRKVWITLSRRSKLAQWVVEPGTHTHTNTHSKVVVVTQAWIIGQCMFHSVCDPDSWCVKQWCSFMLTLAGWGRMERHEGRDVVRNNRGVKEDGKGECHF